MHIIVNFHSVKYILINTYERRPTSCMDSHELIFDRLWQSRQLLMEEHVDSNICSAPPCWIFDECFDESNEAVLNVTTQEMEYRTAGEKMQVDTTLLNGSQSSLNCDSASSSRLYCGELRAEGEEMVECFKEHTSGEGEIPCIVVNEIGPAERSATLLERQQYLQNITDKVSSHFPELAFILDGRDKNVPLLTIYQKSLFSHPLHGMTKITVEYKRYSVCYDEIMERRGTKFY